MRVVPGYGAATTASRGADTHHVTTGAAATTVVQPGAAATTVVQPGATATCVVTTRITRTDDATATCVTTRITCTATHDIDNRCNNHKTASSRGAQRAITRRTTRTTGATPTRPHHEVQNAHRITRCTTRITDARHVQPVQHTTASRGAQRASRDARHGATITR